MIKKEICKAYDAVKPDAKAKERMLDNILKAALEMQNEETGTNKKMEDTNMGKWNAKRKMQIAASLALVLIIPAATAYATDFFGLRSAGKVTVEDPLAEVTEREADIISLQGMADSPETRACAEWTTFYEEYDKDGAILSEIGNDPTEVDPKYDAYTCYTQEMADKVDEIAEKYQLSLLTGQKVADTYEELLDATGAGDVCGNVSNDVYFSTTGGVYYDDGSFDFEGSAIMPDGESACMTDYQFRYSKKGTFCPYYINIENVNDYEQWEYTTACKEKVLLAKSDFKALIIADTEESCIVVNLLGDIMEGTFEIDNKMLEMIADAFDFSAVR